VAGESFTLADILFLYSVELGASVGKLVFGLDLLGDFVAATALLQQLGKNSNVQQLAARRLRRCQASSPPRAPECKARPERFMGSSLRTR
jgi:hypothetical protein